METWIKQHKPDRVTRIVFTGLVNYYNAGKPGWIFRKLISLEESECYKLAAQLWNLMDHLGIQEEYKEYRDNFYSRNK